MPTPPNTSPTTATVLTLGVANTTIKTDVQLAPDGTGFTTSFCKPTNPQKNALWYQYTVPSGVQYVAFSIIGIPSSANYNPFATVWLQSSPGIYTQHKEDYGANKYCATLFANPGGTDSFLFLTIPGTTYYFQVQNDGTIPIDYDLSVLITHAPSGSPLAGDIMIPDDTPPYPVPFIRPSTTHLIGYTAYGKLWWGEDFSVIQQGGWVCSRQQTSGGTYGIYCFGQPPNFDLLTTTNIYPPYGTSFDGFVNDQISKHYVATSGSGIQYLHRFDAATGVKEITFTLPDLIYLVVGVHTASGIVYYADYNDYSTIHRYNINTSTPMSDFLPDNGQTVSDTFVLPSGNVIIVYADVNNTINIYKPDGILVNSFVRNYHRCALDNNLTGMWFWESSNRQMFSHAMLTSLTINDQNFTTDAPMIGFSGGPSPSDAGMPIFGYSDSCPILVYPLTGPPVLPDLSGIYFVSPLTTHDKYYSSENKIPNPTVRSALMGQ